MKTLSIMYRTRFYTLSVVTLVALLPHASIGMDARIKTLIKATSNIDSQTALISVGAVSVAGYLAYTCLVPAKINHDREKNTLQERITQSKDLEKTIVQLYSPLIHHRVVSSFTDNQDTQETENRAEQSALPAYERLYPEAALAILDNATALPILDNAIEQQVNLGNLGDQRVTVQFPFTAFQQKLKTDQETVSESIANLAQLEERCHRNFQDLAKRTDVYSAHDSYDQIRDQLQQVREGLSSAQKRLSLVNRRMPFLPETKREYPQFEAWETERKRITDIQQLNIRLNNLTDQVDSQNTSIQNLKITTTATQQKLEAIRTTIETLYAMHHSGCQTSSTIIVNR